MNSIRSAFFASRRCVYFYFRFGKFDSDVVFCLQDESAALARSDADELRRALDSAEKGDWSAVEMALKPSPAPPPAMSTLCSRTTPSANPTHSRRPVRSKAMAVAATPGAAATGESREKENAPDGCAQQ